MTFTRDDKRSMIMQALLVSPELCEIVNEGLGYACDEQAADMVSECYDKVQSIKAQRLRPQPPPLPADAYDEEDDDTLYIDGTPTVFSRMLTKIGL